MSVLSGKDGTVYSGATEITPISNWKIKPTVARSAYAANDTGGAKKRIAGVEDATGSMEYRLDGGKNFPFHRGQEVTLKLHIDDSAANYYEVPAMICEWDVDCDINEGKEFIVPIVWEGNGAIVAHGILAEAGAAGSSADI